VEGYVERAPSPAAFEVAFGFDVVFDFCGNSRHRLSNREAAQEEVAEQSCIPEIRGCPVLVSAHLGETGRGF
jgi:hypothetical protein